MSTTSKKVFLTPSVFFAFIDRGNKNHEQASAYFRFLAQEKYYLFTDSVSISNTYKTIYEAISPSLAKDFIRTIFLSDINIIYPDERDLKAALKTLVNYQSTDFTFENALITTLSYKRGIQQICTFEYLHSIFGLNVFYLPI